jgi:divalent metal cation (Fe/Co/Zn/Cd) transporter
LTVPLVGRSEKQAADAIRKKVEAMKDVRSCLDVSVRLTGRKPNVDLSIELDNSLGFEEVHSIISRVKREAKSVLPDARVSVQTEPLGLYHGELWKLVKNVAEKVPGTRDVHNIHVQDIDGKLCVDLHLEVSANMTVRQAHDVASHVEEKLKAARPGIAEITIHLESASDIVSRELGQNMIELRLSIEHIVRRFPEIREVHAIRIRNVDGDLHVVLHARFDPDLTMGQAHEITSKIESAVRAEYPNIRRMDIHEEPA